MYPGGEPTSRDTECFSMYSDMSTWMSESSSPKRNSASVRARSVLPTPEGPRKMNEPVGRFGSLMPARARRIDFATATIASSCPTTRLCSSSSMRMSRCDSASVSLKTRMPVHMETMSAISSSPTSGCSSRFSALRHCSSSSRFFCVSLRSLSRSGLVDEVDRLVGEMPVLDVAIGELRGGVERLVGDLHAMVRLVAVAQPTQDLHGVVDRRFLDADLLEAALECCVALEVLAVLVERRGADRLQLAARQCGLEDRGRVDRALGSTGADEIVQLVDEENDVAPLHDLLHDLLQALLELAAVLRAGDERSEVERVDLLVL